MDKRIPSDADAASDARTAQRVLEWARSQPDAPALSDDSRSLSYGELAAAIHETANMLASVGLGPGDRTMVIGENSVSLAILLLGASHLGVCTVVENARRVPAEIASILAHCAPKRVFVVYAQSADAALHASALGAQECHTPALLSFGVALPAGAEAQADNRRYDLPGNVAIVIYTTGTTGQPKGVMLTHRNLSYVAAMIREWRWMSPRDRVYGVLPITHVMGHASVLLGTLHNGASLHLVSRFTPQQCADVMFRHRITAIQGAPAMFAKLAEFCKKEGIHRFPDVRFIGSGGAPIDVTIKVDTEALFGCTLQNGYGLTEAPSICWTRFEDANTDDSVGPPLPGIEIAIRGANGQAVRTDEVGELWMRGPNLMLGYFRDSELTRQVIDAEGWFNTQDLVRASGDGRVFVVGRTKDVIVRSGFNVYPLEVESALNTHPEVLHTAVIGRAVQGNEEVVAYVELVKDATTAAGQLSSYVATLLSPYKRPTEILIVPALPLAANGKVLKSRLAQQLKYADTVNN